MAACQPASEEPSPSVPAATTAPPATSFLEPTASAPSGPRQTSVFDLDAGDCFTIDTDEVLTVGLVECTGAHLYEVFALLDHPAGAREPFPGDQALLEFADTACQPPFEEYVGHDYQTSIWYISALRPSEETWADGDREIVCALNQQDDAGDPIVVTGSAQGAGE